MKVVGMVLAGGRVDELLILTSKRPKSALPFAAIYRIIDFALSNLMHSAIDNVGILSQYRPFSLMRHIDTGEHWDFIGRRRGIRILPPYRGEKAADWYKGTADAIYQNINFINEHNPDLILIVSGDHIYRMDYIEMIEYHLEKKADLTVAFTKCFPSQTAWFGQGILDRKGRLIEYKEKPEQPISRWASMTVYLFRREALVELLKANVKETSHEFGRDIIPRAIQKYRVFGYKFNKYWDYCRTVDAYYNVQMLLLKKNSGLDLNRWQIRTNLHERNLLSDRPPCLIAETAEVKNSIIGDGCLIKGKVKNSILSPGVIVEGQASVADSIIMHDSYIGKGALVNNSICDKDVYIGERVKCGGSGETKPNEEYPILLSRGVTLIGKNARVPAETRIGQNCLVYPDVKENHFGAKIVGSGETIQGKHEEE